MLRNPARILLVTLLTVVGGAGYLWHRRASYVSEWLTNTFQLSTKVDDISVNSGRLVLSKVKVNNPKGSRNRHAFTARSVTITGSWSSLFGDTVQIHTVELVDPTITIEPYSPNGAENNWSLILNRLNIASSRETAKRYCHLGQVIIRGLKTKTEPTAFHTSPTGHSVPDFELQQLRSEDPLTFRLVVVAVITRLLERISDSKITANIKPLPQRIEIDGQPLNRDEEESLLDKLDALESSLRTLLEGDVSH